MNLKPLVCSLGLTHAEVSKLKGLLSRELIAKGHDGDIRHLVI
jgi:hypothetical protein